MERMDSPRITHPWFPDAGLTDSKKILKIVVFFHFFLDIPSPGC